MAAQIVPISSASATSSVSTTNTFAIKLTPRNFLVWKTQFVPLLNFHNMTKLIDGSPTPPTTILSSTNANETLVYPEYTSWFKQDQLLLTWILSSLTEEVFS